MIVPLFNCFWTTFSCNIQLVYNCVENSVIDCIFQFKCQSIYFSFDFLFSLMFGLQFCFDNKSGNFWMKFLLPCFIESFTLAKVCMIFSRLHVFMKWISASVFITRIFRSSNIRATVKASCPCSFLTCCHPATMLKLLVVFFIIKLYARSNIKHFLLFES